MEQRFAFRSASAEDVDAIRALTRAAYATWVPLIGREPLPMQADYSRAVAEHAFLLAEQGRELAGLVELIFGPDHLLIENLAVLPPYQGTGLGSLLLEQAEQQARLKGLSELRLYTNARFAKNITYYSKRGFAEFARQELVPGSIAVHMRKLLPNGA